jgi:hypothetical protein
VEIVFPSINRVSSQPVETHDSNARWDSFTWGDSGCRSAPVVNA